VKITTDEKREFVMRLSDEELKIILGKHD